MKKAIEFGEPKLKSTLAFDKKGFFREYAAIRTAVDELVEDRDPRLTLHIAEKFKALQLIDRLQKGINAAHDRRGPLPIIVNDEAAFVEEALYLFANPDKSVVRSEARDDPSGAQHQGRNHKRLLAAETLEDMELFLVTADGEGVNPLGESVRLASLNFGEQPLHEPVYDKEPLDPALHPLVGAETQDAIQRIDA